MLATKLDAANWLRSTWLELTIAALLAAAEAAMVAPWLHVLAQVFGHPNATVPSPVGMALLGFVAFWVTRGLTDGGWDLAAARGMSLVLWIVLTIIWYGASNAGIAAPVKYVEGLFHLNPTLYALLGVAALAWWRGLMLGSEPEPFTGDVARGIMLRGVPAIGAAIVIGAVAGGAMGRHTLDSAAVALPVLLICGLAVASAVQTRQAQKRVKTGGSRAGLGWVGSAVGLAVAIVLLGLILATIAGPDVWLRVLNPFGGLIHLIGRGLYYILLGVAYVVYLIMWPFLWLFHHFAGTPPKQPQQQGQTGQQKPKLPDHVHQVLPTWAIHTIEIAIFVALVAFVVWLVLRSMKRYRKQESDEGTEEIHESVWSKDLAMDQLRGWLHGLRPRRAAGERISPWDLNTVPATVRDAYRHVLVLAARQGKTTARTPVESPVDYADRVGGVWRPARDPLDDLTLRYLHSRYGERDSDEDAKLAREDWEAIRAYLQREQHEGRG